MAFIVAIITTLVLVSQCLQDGPFELSRSELPLALPLYNHISSIFNNELHIIGGLTQGDISNNNTYYTSQSLSIDDFRNTSTSPIVFNSKSNTIPDFWSAPSCNYQCHVTIDNYIYIVQSDSRNQPYLILYDMNTTSYVPSANYPYDITSYVDMQYGTDSSSIAVDGCVVSDGRYIWFIGSSTLQQFDGHFQNTVVLDTITQFWNITDIYQILRNRKGIGCHIHGKYLYMFGGEAGGSELSLIEKCQVKGNSVFYSTVNCEVLDASIQYIRSHFHVSPVDFYGDDFVLLHGGQTLDAQQHAELFYLRTETILSSIVIPFNSEFSDGYNWVLVDGYLVLIGGMNSTDTVGTAIVYADTLSFFMDYNHHSPLNFSCITTYITNTHGHNGGDPPIDVDSYLLEHNNGELVIEIVEPLQMPSEHLSIGFSGGWFFGRELDSRMLFFRMKARKEVQISVTPGLAADFNVVTLSALTNIEFMNESLRYGVFWFKWSAQLDDAGNTISMPFWRAGVGDVVDTFSFSELGDTWSSTSDPIPEDVYMPRMKSMTLEDAKFRFYTDTCSLAIRFISIVSDNVSTNASFMVGQTLNIHWNLTWASSLIVPIYIKSNTMIGINRVMYIHENNTCVLCINEADDACDSCDQGIQITDLTTYDIEQNLYEIAVSSQLDQVNILQHNQLLDAATFERIVMVVEITIDVSQMNDTNETHGLYPGGEIYMTPIIHNAVVPTQPNGTVYIHFDGDLSFESDAEMFIDFYNNDCIIKLDTVHVQCSDPITVPRSMILKPIAENNYIVSIESNDVQLIGKTTFSFSRMIQTVSVTFSDSLYFGEVIDVAVDIMDDLVYQPVSEITVLNDKYSVQKIISLVMDEFIEQCNIRTPLAYTIESCDYGMEFSSNNASQIHHYIDLSLSSVDTYLEANNARILIHNCPIGQGLVGGGLSSYSCSPCSGNNVGLLADSQCVSCDDVPGVACFGSTNLVVDHNHWMALHNGKNDDIFAAMYQSKRIISKFCPDGYCCQGLNGCNYTQTQSLCASNRDPDIPLCGACLDGYSEVFGSTSCKKCVDNHAAWYILLVFVIAMVCVTLLILVDNPNPTKHDGLELKYRSLLFWDDMQSLQICYFRPLLYFFQSIALITISRGIWFYLTPIVEVLSFDFWLESKDSDAGVCFIPNLKSMDKELWTLIFPCFMFVSIAIAAVLQRYVLKDRVKKRFQFGWNVVFAICLILMGNIITTMLKVTACSTIGNTTVHFYGGYLECYGFYWNFAIIIVVVLILFWLAIWCLLYRMDVAQRDTRKSVFRTITKPYKNELWFWEMILISRRIVLSFFVTFQYFDEQVIQYILVMFGLIYFGLQSYFKPFKYPNVNTLELVCIMMLIVGLVTISFGFSDEDLQGIMSVVVLIPILLFLLYVVLVIQYALRNAQNRIDPNNPAQKKRIDLMLDRWTVSMKSVFNEPDTKQDGKIKSQDQVFSETGTEIIFSDSDSEKAIEVVVPTKKRKKATKSGKKTKKTKKGVKGQNSAKAKAKTKPKVPHDVNATRGKKSKESKKSNEKPKSKKKIVQSRDARTTKSVTKKSKAKQNSKGKPRSNSSISTKSASKTSKNAVKNSTVTTTKKKKKTKTEKGSNPESSSYVE
eukprot:871622_1